MDESEKLIESAHEPEPETPQASTDYSWFIAVIVGAVLSRVAFELGAVDVFRRGIFPGN